MSETMLTYPTERVVGILEVDGDLQGLLEALSEAGVPDDRVEVLIAGDDDQRLDASGKGHGVAGRVKRVVQEVLGDEGERLRTLRDELDAGHYVVAIELARSSDEDRETEKREVATVLTRYGARDVAFYGRYQIEEIHLGA